MGIECGLAAIATATFEWIKANPERVVTVVRALDFGSIPDQQLLERLRSIPGAPAVLLESAEARIRERAACRAELRAIEDAPPELRNDLDRDPLDLDKDWSRLESILRQLDATSGELSSAAIAGGQEVGPPEAFGPARFLDAARVVSVFRAVSPISNRSFSGAAREVDRLRGRSEDGSSESEIDVLLQRFHALRRFYRNAAENALCVAIVLR